MRLTITLSGVTGLVMHNIRLADKMDEFAKAIAEINAKGRNKTEADEARIADLEWLGGLYHDPVLDLKLTDAGGGLGVVVPTYNVLRCLEEGAKITRQGKTLIRALSPLTDQVALRHEGPKSLGALLRRPEFRWRISAGIKGSKITRTRPIFRRWGLALEAELFEDVINLADVERIAHMAGQSEGLGDARKMGYGRFIVEVGRSAA